MRRYGSLRAPWVGVWAVTALLAFLSFSSPASAEDIKGKFYLGGGIGLLTTPDYVRNNAALIVAPLGADGAPFTGDKGEVVSCSSTRTDVFCDPRPDDLIARETQLEQGLHGNLTFGYGVTSTLAVELSAGYYKGSIHNLDVYTTKIVPFSANPLDPCLQVDPNGQPCNLRNLHKIDFKQPITAGEVTEMPIELNAVMRFRKDSNLNPYLGAGVGYLMTDLKVDDSVAKLNKRFSTLHLQYTTDEFGPNFGRVLSPVDNNGNSPFTHPLKVTIDDGLQWQIMGGADYFINDRISFHFEAKYVIAKVLPWSGSDNTHQIVMSFGGEDQIDLTGFPEDMFRKDGSVRIFVKSGTAPNPIDPNTLQRYDCDSNGDGVVTDADFGSTALRDFDHNGIPDLCFNPAPGVIGSPTQTIVAQGGSIDLTNYTFGFGIKFHF